MADYDANGWPQTARNDALRQIRKSLAFHIAGDQHLPAVVRYGIERHGDAVAALAGPAVNSIYPRWYEPQSPPADPSPSAPPNTGDFIDHFGHPLTVLAVANPQLKFRGDVLDAERDKSCGLAIVRFDKPKRQIFVDCWPYLEDVATGKQLPGWPVTIDPIADSARGAVAWLPTLKISGAEQPVVQVFDAAGKLVYNLRVAGSEFQPHVFEPGTYSIRILDPETDRSEQLDTLAAVKVNNEIREVVL